MGPVIYLYLVVLQDKELLSEPDVGMAIVADDDPFVGEERACEVGRSMEAELRDAGRCRCVAYIRPIENNKSYRVGALLRPVRT